MADEVSGGFLPAAALRPPRLEDAGLEDCALPPESIAEAFSRAASALQSRLVLSTDDEGESPGGCVQDPRPSHGEIPDTLVGGAGAGAGAESEVVGGEGQLDLEGKRSCVEDGGDGVIGLEKETGRGDSEEACKEEEGHLDGHEPILVEDLV